VQNQADVLIDDAEAARLIGVKVQTLAVWRMTGRYGLPFVRFGRSVRYSFADLMAWKAAHTVTPGPQAELQTA
jgi:excisionase family DNA binding protein